MRYLASVRAPLGVLGEQLVSLEMKIAASGRCSPIAFQALADARNLLGSLGCIDLDAHDLRACARAARRLCLAVASASAVSVLVIDCTRMGAPHR